MQKGHKVRKLCAAGLRVSSCVGKKERPGTEKKVDLRGTGPTLEDVVDCILVQLFGLGSSIMSDQEKTDASLLVFESNSTPKLVPMIKPQSTV